MPIFDGIDFKGPTGITDIPPSPGVYMIATDASGGVKLLGIYDGGKDMRSSVESNPKRECWQRNRKDTDPFAYYIQEDDPRKRERICRGIIDRRFYEMVCNDPPRDDF